MVKMTSYDDQVKNAMTQVAGGLPLQFIDPRFKTKEICLVALKLNPSSMELQLVPRGNLDYVMSQMKNILKCDIFEHNDCKLCKLEKDYETLKEKDSGNYGEFKSYQDMLNYYLASDYDDMNRKIYGMIHT